MDDAQFGIEKILRPYVNYTTDYQGQLTTIPIMFTEGGIPLDAAAGTPGYSPFLLRGLSIPMGARLSIWLPALLGFSSGGGPQAFWYYKWSISWRLRNVFDYRDQRKAYHYPKQGVGVKDSNFAPPANARVVIPAGVNSVLYAQPRPEQFGIITSGPTAIDQPDLIMVDSTNIPNAPFIPNVAPGQRGYFQQGLGDPTTTPQTPIYIMHEVQAEGDELLIGVTRDANSNFGNPQNVTTWQFNVGGIDNGFAQFLAGSVDIGVYISSGKAT